jgi:hypothetical protein
MRCAGTRGERWVVAAVCVAGSAWLSVPAAALDLEGVKLPDRVKLTADGNELVLNGAGLRSRAFVRVYVAGLYLGAKRSDPKQILADRGPKRISMTMLRNVTAQQLNDALMEGVQENHTASELESLKTALDELSGLVASIGAAKSGAVVTLDYLPGSGTRVMVDGAARGKPVAGDDLYPALLRIWIGDDPVDRGLKRGLLGQ